MKCAALRGPKQRVPCGKPASPTPFLVANSSGFWRTWLCLWCAVEQPRKWRLGALEPLPEPVNVLATYPGGPWEEQASPAEVPPAAQEELPDLSDLMSQEFGL